MFSEDTVIDARPIIKPVDKRERIQLHEIDIARFVFREQNEMVCVLLLLNAVIVRHIKFTADNIFDVLFLACLRKAERGIHIAVIGHRNRIDPVFDAMIDQFFDLDGTVEQAVFGMQVQMYKISHIRSPCPYPTP